MGTHMKTTIEVSDTLLRAAKDVARQRQTTMRALIEEGLRRVLSDANASATAGFKLKDARVRGNRMLIADPRRWQQLEEDHVLGRILGAGR